MVKRIAAIIFIFFCTSLAWMILGATIFARTFSFTSDLKNRVASTWGTQQTQTPPTASYQEEKVNTEVTVEDRKRITRETKVKETVYIPLQSSAINVAFDLQHRQKGLLWYSTYGVKFSGDYTFTNTTDKEQLIQFRLNFPAAQAIYDDFTISIDGVPLAVTNTSDAQISAAIGSTRVAPGKTVKLQTGYKSQGLDSWRYDFGENVSQVRNFSLNMKTNFKDIDFPDKTLSPTTKNQTANGWDLNWTYNNLVSGFQIGMAMPEKLQPGPLAGQISYFAPVSLLFFFFLMFIITTMRGIDLHPMNYFFLATAFFAFHLLMAYLVDHISIHAAFVVSSIVSIFLVVTYLRLVVGIRFAAVEAALAQFVYLVLFSYAFFFKGFTGLAVTIGSILTLFMVMQLTGRIRWSEKFAELPPAKA
jgi:inner membrane protein involved in colicin E2 resistance